MTPTLAGPLVSLCGATLHAVTTSAAVDLVMHEIEGQRGGRILTMNLEILRRYVAAPEFRSLVDVARLKVADGMPLLWASRLQGTPLPERVTGSDLMAGLCAKAARRGLSVLLVGGDPGTAARSAERLRMDHPGIEVRAHSPPKGFEDSPFEWAKLETVVKEAAPRLVFVGLGTPKQDLVIDRLAPLAPTAWWAGIGFVFSFAAGASPRAPRWMQTAGLEWLHRLGLEPRRLWRRYLVLGLPFAVQLFARSLALRAARGEAADRVLEAMPGRRIAALACRRPLDFTLAFLSFAAALPLLVVSALGARLEDRGPAFYAQRRVGLSGREFRLFKIRTMRPGADELKSSLFHHNEMTGPVFKMADDPRITRVGRVLRRFSLDELPQLVNVLRGDMALVGPRPPLPDEVERYEPWQRHRLDMKPGLTGLWQVSGRNEIDFQQWVKLDLAYIDNWSPWRDLWILLRTLPAVISGRGAR